MPLREVAGGGRAGGSYSADAAKPIRISTKQDLGETAPKKGKLSFFCDQSIFNAQLHTSLTFKKSLTSQLLIYHHLVIYAGRYL